MLLPGSFSIPSAFFLPGLGIGGYGGFVRVTTIPGSGFVRQTP